MQINRLFEIIYILLDKETVTAQMLAERFEVSTRTIYRDIETLSASGIPIYMSRGKGGGISILPNFVLNKSVLTDKEKADILSAVKAMSTVSFLDTDSALNKLKNMLGENSADWIEIDFSNWSSGTDEFYIFSDLKTAILSRRLISFSYSNSNGKKSFRTVEPYKLCFKGGAWYLYGFCELRQDFRFFKLRRIKEFSIQNDNFIPKIVKKLFDKNSEYNSDFIKLKLKISSESAYRVYDEFDEYEIQSDGNFIAEVNFPNNNWLPHYIMSFGSDCEVLEPNSLREEIIRELKKSINNYL